MLQILDAASTHLTLRMVRKLLFFKDSNYGNKVKRPFQVKTSIDLKEYIQSHQSSSCLI